MASGFAWVCWSARRRAGVNKTTLYGPGSKSYTFEGPNNHVIALVWHVSLHRQVRQQLQWLLLESVTYNVEINRVGLVTHTRISSTDVEKGN